MIKKVATFCLVFFTTLSYTQIKAVTENGDEVLLYKNNTWKYSKDSLNNLVKIVKNNTLFTKDKKSTFSVKSNKTNVGIWINPKEWSFKKGKTDSPSEFTFNHKNLDIYGMLIAEKTIIPIESLCDIAYENALEAAPDVKVVQKEYRNVNGLDVIMMKMKGTIQGIKFIYYGYYYSNKEGTFQFLTYSDQSMFDDYKKSMTKLLNGFYEY